MRTNEHDLIARSLENALIDGEDVLLQDLLQRSQSARVELEELQAVRRLVAERGGGALPYGFASRVLERIDNRRGRAEARPSLGMLRWSLTSRRAGWSFALAAACVTVALFIWPRSNEAFAPYGSTNSVLLADGSTVELASGSRIRYGRFTDHGDRLVALDGEAFFAVVHDRRPFIVETFNARVVVRGTRFNVRGWSDDVERTTAVTLESGSVEFSPKSADTHAVVLRPRQTSLAVGDTTVVSEPAEIPLNRVMAWRSGGLAFTNQPLPSVFKSLERRFDVQIVIETPELAGLTLTYLNPKPASADEVLSDICHTHGLQFRRTARGYNVSTE